MYHILLVDDELPALRYMETIIKKYAPEYEVLAMCQDGAEALDWLKEHADDVELLLTDISMPDMDGISLAKAARKLKADLHIVIISGYQEFEYAHGAIEAAVDDYILKPVSVSYMTDLLQKIRQQLDQTRKFQLDQALTPLIKSQEYDRELMQRIFGTADYYFAMLRYGNVIYPLRELANSAMDRIYQEDGTRIDPASASGPAVPGLYYFLSGRDTNEWIIYTLAEKSIVSFQKALRRITQDAPAGAVTLVFSRTGRPFSELGDFFRHAAPLLRYTTVIGCRTEMTLSERPQEQLAQLVDQFRSSNLPASTVKRLQLFAGENNRKALRETFLALGKEWDEKQLPQRQVYVMMQQLLHLVQTSRLELTKSTEQIMREGDQLTNVVSSYQELTQNLFEILYDSDAIPQKQKSPEDMYRFAVHSIRENYSQQISIQTVCAEIGISQTYLSRLFRKYGDTSFNACLIQCRMENAQKIMKKHPDIPLHQVATCVGYEDYAYFSKVFRQTTGCTPSQFHDRSAR